MIQVTWSKGYYSIHFKILVAQQDRQRFVEVALLKQFSSLSKADFCITDSVYAFKK